MMEDLSPRTRLLLGAARRGLEPTAEQRTELGNRIGAAVGVAGLALGVALTSSRAAATTGSTTAIGGAGAASGGLGTAFAIKLALIAVALTGLGGVGIWRWRAGDGVVLASADDRQPPARSQRLDPTTRAPAPAVALPPIATSASDASGAIPPPAPADRPRSPRPHRATVAASARPAAPGRPAVVAPAAVATGASLAAEIAAIRQARGALAAGQAAGAVARARRYLTDHADGAFVPEARALEITGTCQLGDHAEARHLAIAFAVTWPESTLLDRLPPACQP